MKVSEPLPQASQGTELRHIMGEWYTGKVGAEKLVVAFPVGWGVKDGVYVVENIFRAESILQVARPIGDKAQAEDTFQGGGKGGREMGSRGLALNRPLDASCSVRYR